MWFWLISSIAGSILGSATSTWFEKTALGSWFSDKVHRLYNWAAERYGFQILTAEDKWRKKYPNVAASIDELESRISKIEKKREKK